ncbi:MAG: hypothetical protein JRI95_07785 [Deltaproteobacteria bacterium]|nr:hypothetical protein [Deltaproteobacteria bacterium]
MLRNKILITAVLLLGLVLVNPAPGWSVQPSMADYTSYPVYLTSAVTPNIMIILDNSGSMNFNAYGTWPGDGGLVADVPYASGEVGVSVVQSRDDAEEVRSGADTGRTYGYSVDLDIGALEDDGVTQMMVGVRFQNTGIPQGALIKSAYISFKAYGSRSVASSFTIVGQDSDHAVQFSAGSWQNWIDADNEDISSTTNRPETVASVAWNNIESWTADTRYSTPDLIAIVQEIVSRTGWGPGSAIVFKIWGTGKRDAYSGDGGTANAPILYVEYEAENPLYYGYFDPEARYTYASNKFSRDPNGEWDGNFLNWLSMRRIDILRKVLMGGLATSRTGGGNQTNIGETPAQSSRTYVKRYIGSNASPHHGNFYYGLKGGYIYVDDDSYPWSGYIARYNISVQKEEANEPEDFYEGNLAGVLQRVGDQARWGNMWFNYGTGHNESGGYVANRVGTNITTLITDLQNTSADTWTPLAETYYVAMQYFKQEAVQSGFDYPNGATGPFNNTMDPYYSDQFIECAKSFVILLTDGASTKDRMIPDFLKDYDEDGNDAGTYPSDGTDYLDDIALYARTNDLRDDLGSDQNLILYTIYAFGDDPNARQLLKDAAQNGGFEDKNGNNRPDLQEEWDKDGDGVPDTYFEATDGYELQERLLSAITDILRRASSGTAVSVLSTSAEGEGTLVQAYFKPSVSVGFEEIKWIGYLHALWVDSKGRLREDTDSVPGASPGLTPTVDKIVEFFFDAAQGQAKFYRFDVDSVTGDKVFVDTNGNGVFDEDDYYEPTEHLIDELIPIWGAGHKLAARSSADRSIWTYVDMDKNQAVDWNTEYLEFQTGNSAAIKPYLGVEDGTAYAYLGSTHDDRVTNLIKFIRGDSSGWAGTPDLRSRTIDGQVWKLGDIVNSTPVTIGRPLDNYGLIYGDRSYQDYFDTYRDRESVVYVGSNGGMLHAFLLGRFNARDNPQTAEVEVSYLDRRGDQTGDPPPVTTEDFGDELWAFIPQALLSHLKWLADPDYTHIYYVDLKPRVLDARIFSDGVDPQTGVDHPNGWGTVLLCGLNSGGKEIWSAGDYDDGTGTLVTETRFFKPSYFALDVTNPHTPVLLWERTYDELSFTTVIPTVARVNGNGGRGFWYAILGSGPSDYDGSSSHTGHIYVVDLATGELYRDPANVGTYDTSETNAFMSSPITVDVGLNYNVDVGYMGETYEQGSNWRGKLYRFRVPIDKTDPDPQNWVYDPDPVNWEFSVMFNSEGPITGGLTASIDLRDNFWVYFGTGRYYSDADRSDTSQQYMYGIKDPFYNNSMYLGAGVDPVGHVIDHIDLLDSTNINVFTNMDVEGAPAPTDSWDDLIQLMGTLDGWSLQLDERERVLTDPKILGGIVLTPTFIPNQDPCGFGGSSNLLGLYFETGTAFYRAVFDEGTEEVPGEEKELVVKKVDIGMGMGSSIGLHVGREEGAKGYIQQSTGVVTEVNLNPALDVQSGIIWWRER